MLANLSVQFPAFLGVSASGISQTLFPLPPPLGDRSNIKGMAELPSAKADPLPFAGTLQPHTGREPDISDNPVGPGEYVSFVAHFSHKNNPSHYLFTIYVATLFQHVCIFYSSLCSMVYGGILYMFANFPLSSSLVANAWSSPRSIDDSSDSSTTTPRPQDTHVHTIGPQTLSQRPTLPAYSFGFGGPSLDVHKYPEEHFEAQMYPGPGKYGTGHSSKGHQYSSKRSNPPSCSFGTGIRDPHSPLRKASQTVPGAANTIKPHVDMGAAPGDYGAGPESIGFQTLR